MKRRLYTPGPTPIPEQTLLEMAKPITHHRLPAYEEAFAEVTEGLQFLFQTSSPVLTLTSSGTGGMEAAVANLLSPGDRAIVVSSGKFGERWAEICRAYGVEVVPLALEWGASPDPAQVGEFAAQHPEARVVFTTHSETSTGALADMEGIARAVRPSGALLAVDAITGIGVHNLEVDAWGIDVAVTGSQKGLMIPPGLAFVSVSPRAWQAAERSRLPRYYFSFAKARASLEKKQNPFTPAITLVMGLRDALQMIRAEGLKPLWLRHERLASATRAGITALGLAIFPAHPSNVLTAVRVPEGIDGGAFVRHLRDRYGILFAGGQDRLRGKIFRIAHLGYTDDFDVLTALAGLERALMDFGYRFEWGASLRAAQESLAR